MADPSGRIARALAAVAALTVALCRPAAPASSPTFRGETYVARLSADALAFSERDGRSLAWWPVGAACSAADVESPAAPQPRRAAGPSLTRAGGRPCLTWRWAYAPPSPVAEQVEAYTFLPRRIEVQARVRWRGPAPRLGRLVYGGRLAAGCLDLEGLWDGRRADRAADPWLFSPVPGISMERGSFLFRRRVLLAGAAAGDLLLAIGGVDDDDITSWDGVEIGRTPLYRATSSWGTPRRYTVPAALATAGPHEIVVAASNADGPGGIWRGPCVLGPRRDLLAAPAPAGWARARIAGRTLHNWCPDRYDVPLTDRFTVSLTSQDRTRELVPENVTSGGRFLVPPYLVAIGGAGAPAWVGIGTLELPRAEDGLRVEWRDGGLTCPFLVATEAPGADGAWTAGPRLALLFEGSQAGVLDAYRSLMPPVATGPRPAWWTAPEYCTWGDQCYAEALGEAGGGALTADRLARWLGALDAAGMSPGKVILDAGWWGLPRSAVDDLHRAGRRVLLWTQPFWAATGIPPIPDHPEWVLHDDAGRPVQYDEHNWLFDFSVAGARRSVADTMASYLAHGGRNADGLKMDFPYTSAPIWDLPADPRWGAGEQFRARALQSVYRAAKQARPDALISGSIANPLFGAVQDLCRLNDNWTADPQTYRRRAAVALAFGWPVASEDWSAYEADLETQAVERPIWGCFSIMSALYRGDAANRPRPLSAAWRSRLKAIFALARLAPVRQDDRWLCDPEGGVCRRNDASGRLACEALAVNGRSGNQALVVARGGRLLATAIAAGRVVLAPAPWPAKAEAMMDDGSRHPVVLRRGADGVELTIEDAAGPVDHYVISPTGQAGPASRPRLGQRRRP